MAPLFSKELKDTDVKKRLAIPTAISRNFGIPEGANSLVLRVKDSDGAVWRFGCTTRASGYSKPVLQAGWLEFVRAKKLQTGDFLSFYREDGEDAGAEYRIEVQRSVRLMGKRITEVVA